MEFLDVSDLLSTLSSEDQVKQMTEKFGLTGALEKVKNYASQNLANLDLNSALEKLSEVSNNPTVLFEIVGTKLTPEVAVEVDDD